MKFRICLVIGFAALASFANTALAIDQAEPKASTESLQVGLKDRNPKVVIESLKSLAAQKLQLSGEQIKLVIAHRSVDVRLTFVHEFSEQIEKKLDVVFELFKDRDQRVVRSTLNRLDLTFCADVNLELLFSKFAPLMNHKSPDVRIALAEAVSQMKPNRKQEADELQVLILQYLSAIDPDKDVRERAVFILTKYLRPSKLKDEGSLDRTPF